MPKLPSNITFEKGKGKYKYTATLPSGKRISFGHRDYEHYKDQIPRSQGGKLWSHKDHKDLERRKNYRKRHRGMVCKDGIRCIDKKYSPAWFSYYFLW